jgi:hypothetical protein
MANLLRLSLLSTIVIAAVLFAFAHTDAKTTNQRWSGGPCTGTIAQRNATFDRIRRNQSYMADSKRHISADEAQIRLLSGLSKPQEEAAAQAQLASARKTLATLQAMQNRDAKDLKKYDAEIAKCKAGGNKTTPSVSMNGQWAGVWRAENTKQFYHLFGGSTSLTYTYQDSDALPGHSYSGTGKCTVKGNAASCHWQERAVSIDPNTNQPYEEDFSGHETLTLGPDLRIGDTNYDTITQYRVIDVRTGDMNHDLPLKAGWVINGRLLRKK